MDSATGEPLRISPSALGSAYGALLLGTFFSLILYGVALHQIFRYIRLHWNDRRAIKSYVLALVILDALHSVVAMHSSYWYLVVNYFNPRNLKHSVWSLNMQPVTTTSNVIEGMIIVICQAFFAYRVYLVGKGFRPLVMITATLFLAELGGHSSISNSHASPFNEYAYQSLTANGFILQNVDMLNEFSWMQSAGFGTAVVSDVTITCVLVVTLYRYRSDFKQSNSRIDVLIAYSICTGLITDLFAIICFIMALATPGDLYFGAADMVCVKVYINSVLAALNARQPNFPEPTSATRTRGSCVGHAEAIDLSTIPHRPIANVAQACQWTISSMNTGATNDGLSITHIKKSDDVV
ncbi:hypothetical protein C8Q79DRAFT_1007263 [Trametes meyenii]|nr:hypothetical protein C8Q79DRAFT_1007263 [Trametes meyenii]